MDFERDCGPSAESNVSLLPLRSRWIETWALSAGYFERRDDRLAAGKDDAFATKDLICIIRQFEERATPTCGLYDLRADDLDLEGAARVQHILERRVEGRRARRWL